MYDSCAHRSVTELEFEIGLLSGASKTKAALVYLRDNVKEVPQSHQRAITTTNPDSRSRLKDLRRRVAEHCIRSNANHPDSLVMCRRYKASFAGIDKYSRVQLKHLRGIKDRIVEDLWHVICKLCPSVQTDITTFGSDSALLSIECDEDDHNHFLHVCCRLET